MLVEIKLCECGCGGAAPIAIRTQRKDGAIKGQPLRFIRFHQNKLIGKKTGEFKHHGYVYIYSPQHPFPTQGPYVKRCRLVMEQVLRRHLLKSEHVHHKNEVRDDDRPENLEVLTLSEHNRRHYAGKKGKMLAARWPDAR